MCTIGDGDGCLDVVCSGGRGGLRSVRRVHGRRVTRESHSVTLAERGREILDLGNRKPPIGSL